MVVTIHPAKIQGEIIAPASKSSMQRACAAALLHKGETYILHPGHSNDDKAAIGLIKQMGAKVDGEDILHVISSGLNPVDNSVNCGESGLGIRMFAPILGLSKEKILINGEGSLLKRPMDFFDEVFPQLDVEVKSNQGKLPLSVKGPLVPKNITIDGSLSSQFLTGLLMAYSAANATDVAITVTNLKSRPYIDLTLDVMRHFKMKTPWNVDYERFYFGPEISETPNTIHYTVEGDWSGGAFLLVGGAIAGPITITGLDPESTQADKKILEALKSCGAELEIGHQHIRVGPGSMTSFEFDATDCPDLFPPLVALASYCSGETRIQGVSRLAHKESDRGLTLQKEFEKLGIGVSLHGDVMRVTGGRIREATVHSNHDHRIAMACATAALAGEGLITIQDADAIDKSYPDFYNDLKQLGTTVIINSNPVTT